MTREVGKGVVLRTLRSWTQGYGKMSVMYTVSGTFTTTNGCMNLSTT